MIEETNKKQFEIARRLQLMLLEEYEMRFQNGTITSTDMANLQRLLKDNGWEIADEIAESLGSKLTAKVDPRQFREEEGMEGVLQFRMG